MELMTTYLQGMKLSFIRLEKFKTIGISLKLIQTFQESDINKRALVPSILISGTKQYPNKQEMQKQLDFLYGTDLFVSTQKIGEESVISFDMHIVNELYLAEKADLLENGIKLFSQVLLNPKLVHGHFSTRIVNEEKRMVKEDLEAQYHDKFEYSFELFKKRMFEGEIFMNSPRGILETIDFENEIGLTAYYESMIKNDQKELLIIGDFEIEEVKRFVETYFHFPRVEISTKWIDYETSKRLSSQKIIDYGDLSQSRISIGFRTNIRSLDPLFHSMVLFNLLFGETDQSILFQTVREQQQLSYYISSAYQPNKGVLFVFAGVDYGKEEEALATILEVLETLQKGEISDESIFLAKEYYISRLRKNNDSMQNILGRTFLNIKLYGKVIEIDDIIQLVESISKAEIIAAGQSLVLDTIHYYKKEDSHA